MTPQPFSMDPPLLPDGGVRLRLATPDDAEAVFAYRGLQECQTYVSQTLTTVEETQAMLTKRLGSPDVVMWVIEQDGRIVGDIGGYRYRPESLGPNEASVRVLLKNGFEREGAERGAVLGRDGTWLDDHALVHRG